LLGKESIVLGAVKYRPFGGTMKKWGYQIKSRMNLLLQCDRFYRCLATGNPLIIRAFAYRRTNKVGSQEFGTNANDVIKIEDSYS